MQGGCGKAPLLLEEGELEEEMADTLGLFQRGKVLEDVVDVQCLGDKFTSYVRLWYVVATSSLTTDHSYTIAKRVAVVQKSLELLESKHNYFTVQLCLSCDNSINHFS